ncbi:MAG: hypothetical protein UR96_C0044G0010 [candidate division WS6 bacterium GW2011_GWC1_36_11]|uniref:Uncharacterized protein n=1 Tax=candidate division WS6 bacterium GW2011_GWC1_36_11 TaxID=1619090 RepID=A0A0G0DAL8_9BACT|nr:MAG: hypothetical protein UR96_C0044G0010 [candidate division WS6 bacterium GW2011_GWC1_36_11]
MITKSLIKYPQEIHQEYEVIESLGNAFVGRPFDTHKYQLIFEGQNGQIHSIFNLRDEKISLSEDRFREIFPNVLKRYNYQNYRLYIVKKGRQRFVIVYTGSEVPTIYRYHNIYEIRKGDVISFSQFGIQICPTAYRRLEVGKEGELLSLAVDKK